MDDHKTTCVSQSLFKGIHKNGSTTNYKDHRNVGAMLSEINAVVVFTKNNITCLPRLRSFPQSLEFIRSLAKTIIAATI